MGWCQEVLKRDKSETTSVLAIQRLFRKEATGEYQNSDHHLILPLIITYVKEGGNYVLSSWGGRANKNKGG